MAIPKNPAKVITLLILALSLSGCAGTIIAGLTISELLTAGSIGSTLITGKGLGEHALDAATGKDCRIIEGAFRSDRDICEEEGSVATDDDFKGLVALLDDAQSGPDRENADFAIAALDKAMTKTGHNNTNRSLLKALKPTRVYATDASYENILPARVMLSKSVDNYTDTMVASAKTAPVSLTDLRRRLVAPVARN